jgi:hypothetical protein
LTTFTTIPKANSLDRLDVEIGDAKQTAFFPQLKAKRWDNEVNLSLRMVDESQTEPKIRKAKDRIIWEQKDKHIHFYPLSNIEEEGYEFEITLLEKPKTNIISFTMQDKGLRYLYQPDLDQVLKAKGHVRPDNVIGSYAVYYDHAPMNVDGGKIYRTGKAFHIYRPRIEDTNGKWVWGELNIVHGLLTVTIPQEFLNNATYPVRHAAGLTLGYTTAGSTSAPANADMLKMGRVLTTSKSDVSKITISLQSYDSDVYLKAVIVLNSDKSIVAVGDATARTSGWGAKGWNDMGYTTHPILDDATLYYVGGINNAASSTVFFYDSGGESDYIGYDDTNSYATPDAPTEGTYGANTLASIYATYTLPVTGQFMSLNRGWW